MVLCNDLPDGSSDVSAGYQLGADTGVLIEMAVERLLRGEPAGIAWAVEKDKKKTPKKEKSEKSEKTS